MSVRRYEYGEREPKWNALIALAKLYGMSPGELLDRLIGIKLPIAATQYMKEKQINMDIVHNKRNIKVIVPDDLKDKLTSVIKQQKEALETSISADQIVSFQKTINKAIDLNGKALEAEQSEYTGVKCDMYFDNPIKPMIDEAVELQNELIKKLERQALDRANSQKGLRQ